MSRYTGPVYRKSRRLGFSILETNKEFAKGKKRTTSPGDHGLSKRKLSNYGEHLEAKQRVKFMYGLSEKQFKGTFERANKMKGDTGKLLLILLESRLDNMVFRMGIAPTRRASRQFVNHGLVKVNGKKVDIPSYTLKVGDVITVKDKLKDNAIVKSSLGNEVHVKSFVKFDEKKMEGTYVRFPEREELNPEINEAFIVEFYNK